MCGSRKYPYPHQRGNWKFGRRGRVKDPGNSGGKGELDHRRMKFPEVLRFNTDLAVQNPFLPTEKNFHMKK